VDAGLDERAVQPRGVRAFGQPEAAAPLAEAVPVGLDPDMQLKIDRLVQCQQRQHRVGRR